VVHPRIYSRYKSSSQIGWEATDLRPDQYLFSLDPLLLKQLSDQAEPAGSILKSEENLILKDFIEDCLERGPGFCILRGLEIQNMTEQEIERSFAQLCRIFGSAISQTKHGNFMGRVEDVGRNLNDRTARGHQTAAALPYHADRCDRTALLCVRSADQGGENSIVSSLKLAEICLEEQTPEGSRLFQSFPFDNRGEQRSGLPPYTSHPIFSQNGDIFTARYIRRFIQAVEDIEEAPQLKAIDMSALDYLDSLISQSRFQYNFKCVPGDIFLMNNLITLHSRKAFSSKIRDDQGRLLLRVWMSHKSSRRLPDSYEQLFSNTNAGTMRGGVWPPKSTYETPDHLKEIRVKLAKKNE